MAGQLYRRPVFDRMDNLRQLVFCFVIVYRSLMAKLLNLIISFKDPAKYSYIYNQLPSFFEARYFNVNPKRT